MSSNAIIVGTGPRVAHAFVPLPIHRRSRNPEAASSKRRSTVLRSAPPRSEPFSVPRRLPNEFYPTPPEAIRALLSVETFDGSIWEPACGEGAIANVLHDTGHAVVSTDLIEYGFGISGVDFLQQQRPRARHIVTNPPYGFGLADAFIDHALRLTAATKGKVAMLLNLSSLSHRRRTGWWKQHPPARLYAIDDIVCWPAHRYGPAPEYFTKHRYFWAVWTHDHRGPTAFWWLSGAEFRNRRSMINNNKKRS